MRGSQIRISALTAILALSGFGAPATAGQVNAPAAALPGATPESASQTTPSGTITPFQKSINISIADGASGGSDNGNISPGTQTLQVPYGGKLVIQTVSLYRGGAIANSTVNAFIDINWGQYGAIALPPCPGSKAVYSGVTLSATFYAYQTSRILVNVYRDSTVGAETDVAIVSGYFITN